MFRSLSDHHQGDTIFVLTSVTEVTDVAACLQVTKGNEFSRNLINWCLCIFLSYMEFSLFVFFTCCNVCVGSCLALLLLCRSGYESYTERHNK